MGCPYVDTALLNSQLLSAWNASQSAGVKDDCGSQVLPEAPVCSLVSLNLLQLENPTYHIAPYLPSVKASNAPLLFIWHVRPIPAPLIRVSCRTIFASQKTEHW